MNDLLQCVFVLDNQNYGNVRQLPLRAAPNGEVTQQDRKCSKVNIHPGTLRRVNP
jgi:hypothetical protein